jgi:hypothetical protein
MDDVHEDGRNSMVRMVSLILLCAGALGCGTSRERRDGRPADPAQAESAPTSGDHSGGSRLDHSAEKADTAGTSAAAPPAEREPARDVADERCPVADRPPNAGSRPQPLPRATAGSLRSAAEAAAVVHLGDLTARVGEALVMVSAALAAAGHPAEQVHASGAALVGMPMHLLDRADCVRAALERAVAAVAAATDAGPAEPWTAAARRAAEQIDASLPIGLQHARVQDALRALVDAAIVRLGLRDGTGFRSGPQGRSRAARRGRGG